MKRRTIYVIVAVVVVAAVVGWFVIRPYLTSQPVEEARFATVERSTLLVAVSASGDIEPQARVALNFEGSGRVTEVNVEIGDAVQAGDVLARLDDRQLALQVQQAQAALKLAQAQLAQIEAGPHPEDVAAAEANLHAIEAQVSAATATRDQLAAGPTAAQIAAAQAQVAAMKLQYEVTLDEHDQIVHNPGDEDRKEQARYDLYSAEKALAAAQAQLDLLLAGADADQLRAAQANVDAITAQQDAAQARLDLLLAGATEEQIADVEAMVTQAQIALEQAEQALEDTALLTPFDGIVAAVNVTAGETPPLGLPAITLLNTSEFHITVSVDELDVGRLVKGQSAQVTLDALPDITLAGTVERIAPVANFEGGVVYYDVTIALGDTDDPVRADMTANATIVVEELADVLTIPTWVVRVDRDTGQTYVHRQTGNDFERVDVTLGVRYAGVAQVLGGLSEGDQVAWVQESSFGFGEAQ
jgi:HlyD family secretion protein